MRSGVIAHRAATESGLFVPRMVACVFLDFVYLIFGKIYVSIVESFDLELCQYSTIDRFIRFDHGDSIDIIDCMYDLTSKTLFRWF